MGIAEFIIGRAFARPVGLTHAQYQESGGDALAETAGNVQPMKPVANGGDRDVVGCGRRSAPFDLNLGLHEAGHAVAGRPPGLARTPIQPRGPAYEVAAVL
jgi:hypothetical protein